MASEHRRHRDRQERQDAVDRRPSPSSRGPTRRAPGEIPMTSRKTAKMTSRNASAPSAATRPTWPAIAEASALARSTCARTSAMAASRVAANWARRPGGGLRGPRGRWRWRWRCGRGVRIVQGSCSGSGSDAGVPGDDSSAPKRRRLVPDRRATLPRMAPDERRHLLTAELLSIGSELTVGETRDTNAGELARSLTGLGVRVLRLTALPDDLETVTDAFRSALEPRRPRRVDRWARSDPRRPDPRGDRRAVRRDADGRPGARSLAARAVAIGEGCRSRSSTSSRPGASRRAVALPNPNGTAPGWFVRRPDGRIVVALPGPPREMRPMWSDEVAAAARGGRPRRGRRDANVSPVRGSANPRSPTCSARTLLRAGNPVVATYARAEAVDVRISAIERRPADRAGPGGCGRDDRPREGGRLRLGDRRDDLERRHRGSPAGPRLDAGRRRDRDRRAASTPCSATRPGSASTSRSLRRPRCAVAHGGPPDDPADDTAADDLLLFAHRARELGGAEVGVAVRARPRSGDTAVSIAISSPAGDRRVRRIVFLTGPMGRSRAALAAASAVLEALREARP